MSEGRSGRVHSPHCEIPIEESVVGLGCRVGQELSGIHRHRRHLDLVQFNGSKHSDVGIKHTHEIPKPEPS